MALAETTLSSAVAAIDNSIVVASATSVAAGRLIQVGGEMMQVTKGYVTASTTVPVLRGIMGTVSEAHPASQRVVHGDAADWGAPVASVAPMAAAAHVRRIVSYTGTTAQTCDLPKPGEDLVVIMNGSALNTLTVPVPTKDLDGCRITFMDATAAAHAITFTGGLGGAGSSYDVVTFNGTGANVFEVVACNELWRQLSVTTGTLTNAVPALA
jgi:hypothetical protein